MRSTYHEYLINKPNLTTNTKVQTSNCNSLRKKISCIQLDFVYTSGNKIIDISATKLQSHCVIYQCNLP